MADRSVDCDPCTTAARFCVSPTGVWWATGRGTPGGMRLANRSALAKLLPLEFGTAQQVLHYDNSGVISGTVKVGATPVPFAVVTLFHRATCRPVATCFCDASGAFSFSDLYKTNRAYFAVALDPEGGTDYNALIIDKLTPV